MDGALISYSSGTYKSGYTRTSYYEYNNLNGSGKINCGTSSCSFTADRSKGALVMVYTNLSKSIGGTTYTCQAGGYWSPHIEFASRNLYEIELWEKYGGDNILCAGVIDVKGRSLEPVEVVADRIRTCLRHCSPDKLWVAPDCGFSQTPRFLANEKMRAMVAAARIVREEIG
ncbi:MAG: hypothetical protein K1X65_18950 [Caldilineales bacterium]|nr:hypothetical protein [Caldilineales bacterium]